MTSHPGGIRTAALIGDIAVFTGETDDQRVVAPSTDRL